MLLIKFFSTTLKTLQLSKKLYKHKVIRFNGYSINKVELN